MRIARHHRLVRCVFLLPALSLAACARAPAFDILGSFFPAWLVCVGLGIVSTILARELLRRYVVIAYPVLVYPCLAACFTFALWLVLFR
ncbi:MAG: YtcA family lipoprotein [Candidatus Sulfotelmatobacter sp.]